MKKNLLVVTTIFPNPKNMALGSYNREIVAELSELFDIDVIVPIPWFKGDSSGAYESWRLRGAMVHHPVYFYPPRCFFSTHDYFYYFSIWHLIKRLTLQKKYSAVLGLWLYPDGMVAKKIAHKLSIPYYVKVLGSDVNRLCMQHQLYTKSMDVIRHASKVFCVSNGLRKKLESLGASSENLLVIYNGINKTVFSPCSIQAARQSLSLPTEHGIVLFVGNLKREKGLYELLCAFNNVINSPNNAGTRLFIIGEGAFEPTLREYAISKGISDAVMFLGRKTPSEVALWMNATSLLCLPSYSEGMPNVVLEALSCNTPVVATSIDGITELACQDDRITLVPPKEIDMLSDALISVLGKSSKSSGGLAINSWADFASSVYHVIGA